MSTSPDSASFCVCDDARDFAAGIWVDPALMIDPAHEQLGNGHTGPAREEAYFADGRIDDDDLRDAAAEDEQRRAQARAWHTEATRGNFGARPRHPCRLTDPARASYTR